MSANGRTRATTGSEVRIGRRHLAVKRPLGRGFGACLFFLRRSSESARYSCPPFRNAVVDFTWPRRALISSVPGLMTAGAGWCRGWCRLIPRLVPADQRLMRLMRSADDAVGISLDRGRSADRRPIAGRSAADQRPISGLTMRIGSAQISHRRPSLVTWSLFDSSGGVHDTETNEREGRTHAAVALAPSPRWRPPLRTPPRAHDRVRHS